MPWSHCKTPFILDDESCPECGTSKASWTVEVNQTRVMQVARKRAFVELELLDSEGQPVAGAAYCFTFAGGRKRKGKLDDQGLAKVRNLAPGKSQVEFTEHELSEEVQLDADFCSGHEGKRLTYRLGAAGSGYPEGEHWIEITLERKSGEPVADEPYRIEFPEDEGREPIEGELDANGHARVQSLAAAGPFTVIFPKRLVPKARELKPLKKDGQPA